MKTIKKLCVYHRRIVDGIQERLEQYITKKYNAQSAYISNGEVRIEWLSNSDMDAKETNLALALFKATFAKKINMPDTWESVAQHWVLGGISIVQVEALLSMDIINVPLAFWEYADKVYEEYERYCAQMMAQDYIDQL